MTVIKNIVSLHKMESVTGKIMTDFVFRLTELYLTAKFDEYEKRHCETMDLVDIFEN